MTEPAPRFVIWAPSYDENSGGIIALHALCGRLNELGWSAKIWPAYSNIPWRKKLHLLPLHLLASLHAMLTYKRGPFPKNAFAAKGDIADAVVVYPEIAYGNPLKAKRVVRWILYHPGRHTGSVEFGEDELLVPYSHEFTSAMDHRPKGEILRITHINPAYRRTNFSPRSGACFLVYKGKDRQLDQHPADAIAIDNLSHPEKAEVFNRAKYLYSYDLYSFYNIYAALCGCIPIVVPQPGLTRESWYADERRRFGIAYGAEDIQWAIDTRDLLIAEMTKAHTEEDAYVRAFAQLCAQRFK